MTGTASAQLALIRVDIRPAIPGWDAAVIGAVLTIVEDVRQNPSIWLAPGG